MFDDLRQQALSEPEEEKKKQAAPAPQKPAAVAAPKRRKKSKVILGMTGPQRFAVSFLLTLVTCVAGFMFLLITNKIGF